MAQGGDGNEALNRNLNNLPEEILTHILSNVPTLEIVQSSLLSRKWRSLWSRLPYLNFSYELFPVINDAGESLAEKCHRFSEFVDHALMRRSDSSPVQTFRLSFIYHHRYRSRVDSWVHSAVTRFKARELHLDLFIDLEYLRGTDRAPNDMYDFSLCVLRDGCVERLSLTRVDLILPGSMATMGLRSMRSLFLDRVDLTDQMWRDLLLGCPNLEDFELVNCGVEQNVKICSRSLKRLKLQYFYDSDERNSLEIDCPNLVSLSVDCCDFTHYRLKNSASLVEICVGIVHHWGKFYKMWTRAVKLLGQAPHVKHLNVQNWWFPLLTTKDSFPKTFVLHNVNLLELRTGYTQYDLVGMAALLDLCPNLETLILHYLYKIEVDESLPEEILNKEVKFNMPRLKEVKMLTFTESEEERNFVRMLKKQGVVLEKITLFPVRMDEKCLHQCHPIVLHKQPRECEVSGSSSP